MLPTSLNPKPLSPSIPSRLRVPAFQKPNPKPSLLSTSRHPAEALLGLCLGCQLLDDPVPRHTKALPNRVHACTSQSFTMRRGTGNLRSRMSLPTQPPTRTPCRRAPCADLATCKIYRPAQDQKQTRGTGGGGPARKPDVLTWPFQCPTPHLPAQSNPTSPLAPQIPSSPPCAAKDLASQSGKPRNQGER